LYNNNFFNNFKIKKNGLNFTSFLNTYKIFGLPVFFGKLSFKDASIIENICKRTDNTNKRFLNIDNIKNIKTLKGIKHNKNHPVNGQRTRVNAKTRKFRKII
jgi:hypothetical protein